VLISGVASGKTRMANTEIWIMVSYLDLILLIPIGIAIWRGWKNGFVMEVFSVLALFVGVYLAVHLSDAMTSLLRKKMDVQAEYLPVFSFVLILLIVGVGLYFLGKVITNQVKSGGGDKLNSSAGAFFSLTRYLLILSVAFLFFNALDAKYDILPEHQKQKSYFYKPIYQFSLTIMPAIEGSDFYQKMQEKGMAPVLVDKAPAN
jgi:membrane protein required for colicin V production